MRPVQVQDLMTEKVFTARPDDDLARVRDVMYEHGVRHVPVVDNDNNLEGLISERDLLRNALIEQSEVPSFVEQELLHGLKVRDVMVTGTEVVEPDSDLREAARIMFDNKYGCLPVVSGTRLVGILTEADFVRRIAQED